MCVAAQTRRADCRLPAFRRGLGRRKVGRKAVCRAAVCGKLPYEPEVGKAFQSSEGIRIAVFLLEDYPPTQGLCKTALARHTEFFRKICMDVCNRSDFHFKCNLWTVKISKTALFINFYEKKGIILATDATQTATNASIIRF